MGLNSPYFFSLCLTSANPPFKTDFSATRDRIEQKWQDTNRFFAGVPKIPNTKKESMAIYLLFIELRQYIADEYGLNLTVRELDTLLLNA